VVLAHGIGAYSIAVRRGRVLSFDGFSNSPVSQNSWRNSWRDSAALRVPAQVALSIGGSSESADSPIDVLVDLSPSGMPPDDLPDDVADQPATAGGRGRVASLAQMFSAKAASPTIVEPTCVP
jgi:hypothetical protein